MKQILLWLTASAVLMLVLPWLAVTFVPGDSGMAVCLLLFFVLDPIYAVCAGGFAGRDIKRRWAMPLLTAGFFLLGAWSFFDRGEPAFLLYAAAYLVLGLAGMLISRLLRKNS